MSNILQTDVFLVALSQYTSFKIVPTVEDQVREDRAAEEKMEQSLATTAANAEANANRRQKRLENIAIRQEKLLKNIVEIEALNFVLSGF